MAFDLTGTETKDPEQQDALGPDFYKGVNFLGNPTSISLTGQEPGQSASPSAGGAPVGPSGSAPPLTSVTGGGMTGASTAGGIPAGLDLALKGLGLGDKALKFFEEFGLPPSAGAMETPSGQWTVSAPEVLRGMQFPEGTGSGEIPGASIPSADTGGFNLGGVDLGGLGGAALGSAGSILGLEEAIRTGNYGGIAGPAVNLATLAGTQAGYLPAALTSITGAGIPFAAAITLLTTILQDEIADPQGRKSAVQDFNQMMSQQVPGEARSLQFAAALNPLISDSLSTEQAMQLFQVARAGIKSEQLLADPISRQGKEKAGVDYGEFPGLNEAVQSMTPQAWLATVRLQDLLAKRGVTPEQLQTGDSPAASSLYGYVPPEGLPWMTPEQIQFGQATMPSGGPEGSVSPEGPSLWLSPGQLLGDIGHYAGYEGTQPGYTFDPATTQTLAGIQPGSYESGLRSFLESQPGYAGSPVASLWETQAADPGTVQNQVAAEFSPQNLDAPSSSGGEQFNFDV